MANKKQWVSPSIQMLSFDNTNGGGGSKQFRAPNAVENAAKNQVHDGPGTYHAYFDGSGDVESNFLKVYTVSFEFNTTRYGPS